MATIISYRDLVAWQKAIDLTGLVYRLTEPFPAREQYGLAFHMRKTAVAIPSNIAEGTRRTTAGYFQRVTDALAEHAELETQAIVAERLRFLARDDMYTFVDLATDVGRLTHALARSLDGSLRQNR